MLIYPVILVGGSGTRLWPLSTADRPKQFLPLTSDCTMMEETLRRVSGRPGFAPPILVTGDRHVGILGELLKATGLTASAILVEPEGRNTAPAVAMAAHWIAQRDPDALMLVMPSDHVIGNLAAFHQRIADALPVARSGRLVTFGVQPDHPATGYGYIAKGAPLDGDADIHEISEFVEKPTLSVAQSYLDGRRHSWNAGIFLFTASAFLSELALLAPDVAGPMAQAMAEAVDDGTLTRPGAASFGAATNQSIDYAVMEKTRRAVVVPVDIGWSDVGSWDALWAIRGRDERDNSITGPAVVEDGSRNLIFVDGGPPVGALGVSDMVVISTAEAVLILPRNRSQEVKTIMEAHRALHARRADVAEQEG
ncbi:mannose-1-phosphate guanylyltransferase/mannose-6-phosphate isomerase [Sphingobium rhizovicinum]|uniref:Mannose-1-phosphate guanylyltransferase/mannose-6-phosphate isomerase n=1 Tax=Sphingobium rhizovicinum TaxID=432308 RepID=A0ABV7ND51_9SPHN